MFVIYQPQSRSYLTRLKSGAMTQRIADAAKWKTRAGAEARRKVSGGVIVELKVHIAKQS